MSKSFDPSVNFFGTGTVTDDAEQRPYDFSGATVCNGADRQQPFFDSFGAGPACRPVVVGEQNAKESDIDLSADPRTGRDFNGSEIDNTRIHLEFDWQIGDIEVTCLGAYTENETEIQEDFDFTNDPILSSITGSPFDFSQFGFSAVSDQEHDLK